MKCTKLTNLLAAVSFLLVASTASANVLTYDDLGLSSPVMVHAAGLLADVPDSYRPVTGLTVLDSECKQDMLIGSLGKIPDHATLALLAQASPFALM